MVEFASEVPAAYCGKVLAELGAEVIKVEPPQGDPLRARGPFIGQPGPDRSALFSYYATGKKSVVVTPQDGETAAQLGATADILLVDANSDVPALGKEWRGLRVAFSGMSGSARTHYEVPDLVAYALSGYLYTDGSASREPLKGGGQQPFHAAGNYAILAVLATLFARRRSHAGRDELHVPTVEAMATMHWYTTVMWTYARLLKRRIGNRLDITHPVSLYRCADGWVAIGAGGNDAWAMLTTAMGRPELADDPRFQNGASRLERADEVDTIITTFTSSRPRTAVMNLLQELRVPCGLVSSPGDLLADPQYRERKYWASVELDGQRVEMPGAPFKCPDLPFVVGRPPVLGQHTQEVIGGLVRSESSSSRGASRG